MTINDTNSEKESQTLEPGVKIDLKVEVDENNNIGIKCNYTGASSVLLLQAIAYMLDTAYKGDVEIMKVVSEQIPDIVTEYCRLKELQREVDTAEEDLQKTVENLSDEILVSQMKEELSNDNMDMDFVMRLTSELMKRKVKDDREEHQKKATDSIE